MSINPKRCFFHSIEPIRKKNVKWNVLEGQLARLDIMLKSGYLFPGNQLKKVIPDTYEEFDRCSGSDSVYLAQHHNTELPSYGGSFFHGEFSAFLEHIASRPSWVFDEWIVNNKKIEVRSHMLSEEVCIQEPIHLKDAIAIMLPYETPATYIRKILLHYELYEKEFLSLNEDKIEYILQNKEICIKESYQKINQYRELLQFHAYDIPLVDEFGELLNEDKELPCIKNGEEAIKILMKK